MRKPTDWLEIDEWRKTIKIFGITYSFEFFQTFGTAAPGMILEIIKIDTDTITVKRRYEIEAKDSARKEEQMR